MLNQMGHQDRPQEQGDLWFPQSLWPSISIIPSLLSSSFFVFYFLFFPPPPHHTLFSSSSPKSFSLSHLDGHTHAAACPLPNLILPSFNSSTGCCRGNSCIKSPQAMCCACYRWEEGSVLVAVAFFCPVDSACSSALQKPRG